MAVSSSPQGALTLEEAAKFLRVSKKTALRWARLKDPLPFSQPGGRKLLVTIAQLEAWLSRQRLHPTVPLRKIARASR